MRTLAIIVAVLFGLSGLYVLYGRLVGDNGDLSSADGTGVSKDFTQVTLDDIEHHIGFMQPAAQKAVFNDVQKFRALVKQENQRQALLKAANLTGTADEAALQYQIQRLSDDRVIQRYVNQRLREVGMPKGFPNEQQVQQFYAKNKSAFTTAEKIPVWQIFWVYTSDMGDKEKVTLQQQATKVAKQLKSSQQDFAKLAREYSQHETSRIQGGFMGLLKVDELLPGIKEQILDLKPGRVSDPVVSKQGVHILLRAATVPPEVRPLSKVKASIVDQLRKQYLEQQKQRVYKEALQQFSLPPDDTKIHSWWQKTRTKMAQQSAGN